MKILAVCGFGVGSSMVLKMSIEKALKEMEIVADVENTDISSAKAIDADLYLTSEELQSELEKSVNSAVLPVRRYMDIEEIKNQISSFLSR